MKQNTIYKYQLLDHRNGVLIFCAIILAIIIFIPAQITYSEALSKSYESTRIAGIDMASAVFLFICGLVSFKECFLFALQNGISRKSLFKTRLYVTVTLAVTLALFSLFLLTLGAFIEASSTGISYSSLLSMIYPATGILQSSGPFEYLNNFLFLTVLLTAAQALGYLITVALYRMNKKQKISYIVGFYILFFVILPVIDMFISGQISTILLKFLDLSMGISAQNPVIGMFSLTIFAVIVTGSTWLLIRNAEVKN